jgi:hypothetical protein
MPQVTIDQFVRVIKDGCFDCGLTIISVFYLCTE